METALSDPTTSKSYTGWVITYAGCVISWASKLQTQTALSTTEAEYIVLLSTALQEQIPLMNLLCKVVKKGIDAKYQPPMVHCKTFEDNSEALEMACMPKVH